MKNILIIEDDVVFSRSISNWLKKGYGNRSCGYTLGSP